MTRLRAIRLLRTSSATPRSAALTFAIRPKLPPGYDALAVKDAWYQSYILDEDVAALVKELRGMLDDTGKRYF